jgi:diacylglycerol kinase family enzyme
VRRWQVSADGQDLSGNYFALELLNIRFVGPNLPLAPGAFPGDGLLDVVMIGETDREPLLAYLENRLHLASAQMPELRIARARRIEIVSPAGVRWHVDDENWPAAEPPTYPATLTVRCLANAATFIAAPDAGSANADGA